MSALAELWVFMWSWYNLPFTLSIIFALLLSALQGVGVLDDAVGGDHDFDHATDSDLHHEGWELGSLTAILDFLGVGRVPITLLLLLLSATFGLTGLILSRLWVSAVALTQPPFFVALWLVALLVSVFLTARLGRAVATLLPAVTTTATTQEALVGRTARVISPQVDRSYGQVRVRDAAGTLITVFAVTVDETAPITRDSEVVLVDFDPQRRRYTIMPLDDVGTLSRRAPSAR